MAFILKENNNNNKGILVLKHLELKYYSSLDPNLIDSLRKKFIIGVYFGFHFKIYEDIKNIDFYLAEDNVIEFSEFKSTVPRCNLNGYNFIDNAQFEISHENKITDLIYIGNSSRRKNLKSFLRVLGNLEKRKILPSVIIINVYRPGLDEFLELLKIKFCLRKLKNKNLTYLEVNNNKGRVIPKKVISKLLKSSKFLVLTSRSEGAARVVAEALLCGLGIISYGYMKGGTNNHLGDCDYIYYNERELEDSIISSLSVNHPIQNNNLEKFNQKKSKELLVEFLNFNFSTELGSNFQKQILEANLSNSFQSHNTYLKRSIPTNKKTDECLSTKSLYKLICFLLNQEVKSIKILKFSILDFMKKIYILNLKLLRFVTKNFISSK